jgi:hypothetical protein
MPQQPVPAPGPITRLGRLIHPADANVHGTLFGGEAMRFMDEAAGVAAVRYARGSAVPAHIDAIDFVEVELNRRPRNVLGWDSPADRLVPCWLQPGPSPAGLAGELVKAEKQVQRQMT